MARNLKIRDLTLRDGQQSSFATRMNQEQIDRCLPFYKDANFYAMEVWGGAVPDSVMRYLDENPWTRLETIHKAVGDVSKLTALSRGRNLFGYSPYTDEIIDGFCRNSIRSGLGIMRIFDALNDVDNVKSTVKYVKQYGGIADCAVCYTVDPKYPEQGFFSKLFGKKNPDPVFTDAYFLDKARQMAALGADMITIKDMSGLIPPRRVATLVRLFKKHLSVPVDFHTHCTPGYGLASVLAAIVAGVDVVDTNCWYFAGGTGAPAIELVYVFCKKLGIDTGVNMEAVAKINKELREIRKELNMSVFGVEKPEPKPFNPLTDKLPDEVDALFDRAIEAAQRDDEAATIDTVLAFEIPRTRAVMHLDTVFTQVDVDKFTVHPGILGTLRIFELTGRGQGKLTTREVSGPLEQVLAGYLGLDRVQLIRCGGSSQIAAEREQWNDGSNTLCIAPGVVVVYDRNYVTNQILEDSGIRVLKMPSAELSRGRGGPRCMSMPLWRDEI